MGCARPLQCILSLCTSAVYAFDVTTNWFAFINYLDFETSEDPDHILTIFMGIGASLGSLTFLLSLKNAVFACRACGQDDVAEAQQSVERWQEVTGFLQLILQDCVVAIIIYMTFRAASCDLYTELFVNSFVAELALIGALSGSVWRFIYGLITCLCGCCTQQKTGCGWGCVCCACRIVSTICAIGLVGFISYQLFTYNDIGFEERTDCN